MQMTIHLGEREIADAVSEYLASRGHAVKGAIAFTMTQGDRPGDANTISASATVEPKARKKRGE